MRASVWTNVQGSSRGARVWACGLSLVFLAAHVGFLPPTLEDIDSMNFALGIRSFDPVKHQPHPPGYPLFIALGKLARPIVGSEAAALAVWGAVFGALAVFPLFQFFRCLESSARPERQTEGGVSRAALAVLMVLVCPLFWFSALRPLSDVPGFAMALVAQACLATAFVRQRSLAMDDPRSVAASGRLIVLGAFVAALGIGFRSQVAWLTLPLLALVLLDRVGRGAAGALLGSLMAFATGILLWAVPLVVASGGPVSYRAALSSQLNEHFSQVGMLVLWDPAPRQIALGLLRTLVYPWVSNPLGSIVLALGVIGLVEALRRSPVAVLLLTAAALPYGLYHLIFQETMTTRYALPLIPACSYLLIRGLSIFGRRLASVAVAALTIWSLSLTLPAATIYRSRPSPIFQALRDLEAAAQTAPQTPALAMHHVFLRATDVMPVNAIRQLRVPPTHEWLELTREWIHGSSDPIWFLADPARTDLALIDPASRRTVQTYGLAPELRALMGGVRPATVDWIEVQTPGWFLTEGWALTPETAGLAHLDHRQPSQAPIAGYVRRRNEKSVLLLGGRNLAARGGDVAEVKVTIDGRLVDRVQVPPDPGSFLRMLTVPADALSGYGRYAELDVSATEAAGSSRHVDVAIEQFDVQPAARVVYGFDAGWHELEFNPITGQLWRWTSERATTRVHHAGKDLVLTISGESPLRYFDEPPHVVVRAGARVLARQSPSADFEIQVQVPAAALEASNGTVTLETDKILVPAEQSRSADRRHLGLRIFKFEISEAPR